MSEKSSTFSWSLLAQLSFGFLNGVGIVLYWSTCFVALQRDFSAVVSDDVTVVVVNFV